MSVFDKLIFEKYKKDMGLLNLTDEFFALYIKKVFEHAKRSILIVTPTSFEAGKINDSLNNYTESLLFLADEVYTPMSTPELKLDRLDVINNLIKDNKKIVVTDLNGYLKKISSLDSYKKSIIKIKKDDNYSRDKLVSSLIDLGYARESVVTKTGEFSVRGFVVDIFLVGYENPIRIEFFGDEIDSIREFDADDQKSIREISSIDIYPNSDTNDCNESIISYLYDPIVIYKDYEQLKIREFRLFEDLKEDTNMYFALSDMKVDFVMYYFDFDSKVNVKISEMLDFGAKKIPSFYGNIETINKYLQDNLKLGSTIIMSLSTDNNRKFLDMLELDYVFTSFDNIVLNKINVVKDVMSGGFSVDKYIFITPYELFNKREVSKKKRHNLKFALRIKDLSKLEVGDYVVHNSYGIGKYNGIKTMRKNGILGDYLEVLYDKGDKLYIPAAKIELISKYSGKDGYIPKINALDSSAWYKTKQKVREKIRYEADRLIKVQAMRSLEKGFAFSKDSSMQTLFESEFKYEDTKDQDKVLLEIKKDMESSKPMDRILCGDVGYGKTEVAFRAAFKCVLDSKQVMYLCPTTLLSSQQYDSCKERFVNYPVNIGLLNRFTSQKETKKILKDFSEGKIDILIGTHRLLSDDVKPYDLGLLIVDEEQRFGVAHKEKIKEMRNNIDVLTLTATPIPRTLQMAMLGIKDLSLIETPPKNRRSIQTYVTSYDKRIIRDAIYKELSRGGQVFVLYNNTYDIDLKKKEIEILCPDADIVVAHGKLSKTELENRVSDFVSGKYNVLLCTTIIETGVDIANANTLIIVDADRFGLSQLYQIRGRVGRSDRQAYAYLLYQPFKKLNEVAVKRLSVIKDFTELGSGFAIASRDLSIRGAGDILGAEQAGFIDSVGIDLYMKMLDEEIKRQKGILVEEEIESEVPVINVDSHIDDSYVSDEDIKIEIHKMINSIKDQKDLINVKKELEDRFGKINSDIEVYMYSELFENMIKNLGIKQTIENTNSIEIVFDKEVSKGINYEDLFSKSIKISRNFKFSYIHEEFRIKILKNGLDKHPIYYLIALLDYI